MDITDWQQKVAISTTLAAQILSYSTETIRKMRKAGVLKGYSKYITVASLKRFLRLVEEGQSPWPVKEKKNPVVKKAPARIGTTRRPKGTAGQSSTKGGDTKSPTEMKKRRVFSLKN